VSLLEVKFLHTNMDFKILSTIRGNKSIVCEGYFHRFLSALRHGENSWRCCDKRCSVRLTTDMENSCIINVKNEHNHEPDERKTERQQLRCNAKRKASEDATARPSY